VKIENSIRSITIGSFDGVHLAHQELISLAEALVIIERNSGYLTPGYKRIDYTDKPCFFYHFDKIKSLSAKEFVIRLQEDFPYLEKVVVGYDFHFGKSKEGDAQMLRRLFGGEVVIVDEVSIASVPVHSRTIKSFLKKGDIAMANKLLGRNYLIEGMVIKGQGLGKKELVPTLNLKIEHYQLPMEGVYAGKTKIAEQWFPSVTFLGHRVSTDGSFAVETHILRREFGEVEGKITILFEAFLRENQKFETLEQLKTQIEADIAEAEICNQV